MSTDVTNQELINVMTSNRETVLNRISNIETKIDKFYDSQHDISSRLMLAESKISDNANDINKNWIVTRKLDSKITRWGGVIAGLSIASGFVFKFAI